MSTLKEVNGRLNAQPFVSGFSPSSEDARIFNEMFGSNVNVIQWSSILFDIKAWDDTIDLEALAQKLHAIQRDGLIWGDHKLVPVAFGVKKLQQLIVIEDDKVSGDDLEEMIMGFEEEVQSMDIVAWNKI
ncbi:EF-1 guanine nucleotide exchange domain family protein [Leishmania donovani]|uniref:EF-1 guanine nucleotide exchange domain family protein n=1 Tax=Leishmania donovani TaxID=5661 RepID=A0A504X3S1_LEIDO|nr:EF-1 guanine nucleotide exchange domain family protein [Leishmania donovani]